MFFNHYCRQKISTSWQSSLSSTVSLRMSWRPSWGGWASWAVSPTIRGHKRPPKPRLLWPVRCGVVELIKIETFTDFSSVVIVAWYKEGHQTPSHFQLMRTFSCLRFFSGHRSSVDLDLSPSETFAGLRCSISPGILLLLGDAEWRLCAWECLWMIFTVPAYLFFKKKIPLTGGDSPQRWWRGCGLTWTKGFSRCHTSMLCSLKLKDTTLISYRCSGVLYPKC